MKPRETLDEEIDRIASQMTQSDEADGVDIRPVWMNPPAHRWFGWRVAGVAGVAAVLLAVALMRMPDGNEGVVEPSVGSSPLLAWSALRVSMSDSRSGPEFSEPPRTARVRAPAAANREIAPVFGIPSLETPTPLTVTALMTDGIAVDAMAAVDTIEVPPLSIGAIEPGHEGPKEQ